MKRLLFYPFCFVFVMFLLLFCHKKNLTIRLDVNESAPQIIYGVKKMKELEQTKAFIFSESDARVGKLKIWELHQQNLKKTGSFYYLKEYENLICDTIYKVLINNQINSTT